MSNPATQLDLDTIEARARAATPGPWTTDDDTPSIYAFGHDVEIAVLGEEAGNYDGDAAFIAAARTDLPTLLTAHRAALAEIEALRERGKVMADAIRYVLDRTQIDPDLRYYLGFGTEAWARLTHAEAMATGDQTESVRRRRDVDRQPAHSKREPEVLTLRKRLESADETEESDDE